MSPTVAVLDELTRYLYSFSFPMYPVPVRRLLKYIGFNPKSYSCFYSIPYTRYLLWPKPYRVFVTDHLNFDFFEKLTSARTTALERTTEIKKRHVSFQVPVFATATAEAVWSFLSRVPVMNDGIYED